MSIKVNDSKTTTVYGNVTVCDVALCSGYLQHFTALNACKLALFTVIYCVITEEEIQAQHFSVI